MKHTIKIMGLAVSLSLFVCSAMAQSGGSSSTNDDYIESNPYLREVEKKISSCPECDAAPDSDMLIYDAKCHCFSYKKKNGEIKSLDNLNNFRPRYKQPFVLKIINVNQYLQNIYVGSSDVNFNSSMPTLMKQYLLQNAVDSMPGQAPTQANGGSENAGADIFTLITKFKSELDRIKALLGDIETQTVATSTVPVFVANANIQTINRDIENLSSKLMYEQKAYRKGSKSLTDNQEQVANIKTLNLYNKELDNLADELFKIDRQMQEAQDDEARQKILTQSYQPTLQLFIAKSRAITRQIDNNVKKIPRYDELKNDKNYQQFKHYVDSLAKQPAQIISNIDASSQVNLPELTPPKPDKLKAQLDTLEGFYNSFVDEKINAYSVCYESITCCGMDNPSLSFKHFNALLGNITREYIDFRKEYKAYRKAETGREQKEEVVTSSGNTNTSKPKPSVMQLKASDITFDKNGNISGLSLLPNMVEKPAPAKTPTDGELLDKAVDSLGALWFAFEKSVEPEYIMKQILFVRNLTRANFSYTSPPIYPYGNRLGLIFTIIPSDSAKKYGVEVGKPISEYMDFQVFRKPLFSFSAGTFAAFGNTVRDSTYEFQREPAPGTNIVTSNSPYRLKNTGRSSTPIGACAMANVTGCVTPGVWWGGSIGVGVVATPKIKVAYLASTTLSFGTYHQFHISVGAAAMNVDYLKQSYRGDFNTLYSSDPGGDLYEKRMKVGFMTAFSYTVFNLKSTGKVQNGRMVAAY